MKENEPNTPAPQAQPPPKAASAEVMTAPVNVPAVAPKSKMRKPLLWLAGIALVFLAGVLTMYFVAYKPALVTLALTQDNLAQALGGLDDAATANEGLAAGLKTAQEEVDTLKTEKQVLEDELQKAKNHLDLLHILADVSTSRLALVFEDAAGAQSALSATSTHLGNILPVIEAYDANMAKGLSARLDLILSNLVSNPESAKIDFELFTKDLLIVESALFGK